jgi:hypothetical protein
VALIVGRGIAVGAVEGADPVEVDPVPRCSADEARLAGRLDLLGVALPEICPNAGLDGPEVPLLRCAGGDGKHIRSGELPILVAHHPDGLLIDEDLADGDSAVLEADLHDPGGSDLLDILPVDGLLVELVAIELELVVVQGDDLTLEPLK